MEGKTQLRSDLKKFRAQRTSLKMAVMETLNHVKLDQTVYFPEKKRPSAIRLEDNVAFAVGAIRIYNNSLQVKDADDMKGDWMKASFDYDEPNWMELADVATLLLESEIWD